MLVAPVWRKVKKSAFSFTSGYLSMSLAIAISRPCCESGDILTPKNKRPNILDWRIVPKPKINDLVVVGAAGAYCGSMSTINFNSYPQAPEVMLELDGTLRQIRKRQDPDSVWANEV